MHAQMNALRGLLRSHGSTCLQSIKQLCDHQSCILHTSAIQYGVNTIPLHTGRPTLVVLGTGWAAARLMVFTPLLASACVGTLEGRAVAVPILNVQKALRYPQNTYYSATATAVHPQDKLVECTSADGIRFFVNYDTLAICTGAQGSTFNIKGVTEHAHFLREIGHADAIRNKLIENWSLANVPGRSTADRSRLLHVVVVGGGPTGVEFAGELADFVNSDLAQVDNDRARDIRITLIEATELLGTFDAALREYAARKLRGAGVHLRKGVVQEVRAEEIVLQGGDVIRYGLCVWSTGVGPTPFVTSLPFAKTNKGRLAVDEYMRLMTPPPDQPTNPQNTPIPASQITMTTDEHPSGSQGPLEGCTVVPDVYALGDCCANVDKPLPPLAQVAEQQGRYLAQMLNSQAKGPGSFAPTPFVYKHLGSMATVGGKSAVLELADKGRTVFSMAGFTSWVAWRSAYLTRLGTWRQRLYVAFNWASTLVFGRDLSRW